MTNTSPGFLKNMTYPEEPELRKAQVGRGLREKEELRTQWEHWDLTSLEVQG